MGSLLIITGPPGAGKSTVAKLVADAFDPSVLVQGDVFFEFLAQGAVPPWLPESQAQNTIVTEATAAAVGCFVRGDYTTVFDGIVGPWFLPTFIAAAGLDTIQYVILFPSLDVCLNHIRSRVGHGLRDEAAATKMHEEFATSLNGIDPRHVLHDPMPTASQVANHIIAQFRNGAFTLSSR